MCAWKIPEQMNVNPLKFIDCETKYHAYLLGMLWADGYISPMARYRVELVIIKSDFDDIRGCINKTGEWGKITKNYQRADGIIRKPQEGIATGNKMLCDFLVKNDYRQKSVKSADKILKNIPKTLHKYWYRGYYDGDGYCYYRPKKCCQLGFGGSYEQDWTFVENLMNKFKVSYKIKRDISNKGHKSSVLRVTKKESVLKFFNFIYEDYDALGFSRKYKTYQSILE